MPPKLPTIISTDFDMMSETLMMTIGYGTCLHGLWNGPIISCVNNHWILNNEYISKLFSSVSVYLSVHD